MEYDDNRFAVLEWGSAFRWGGVCIGQGEKGAIKLGYVQYQRYPSCRWKDTYFLIHETQEEDDDRTVFTTAQKWTVRFNR